MQPVQAAQPQRVQLLKGAVQLRHAVHIPVNGRFLAFRSAKGLPGGKGNGQHQSRLQLGPPAEFSGLQHRLVQRTQVPLRPQRFVQIPLKILPGGRLGGVHRLKQLVACAGQKPQKEKSIEKGLAETGISFLIQQIGQQLLCAPISLLPVVIPIINQYQIPDSACILSGCAIFTLHFSLPFPKSRGA